MSPRIAKIQDAIQAMHGCLPATSRLSPSLSFSRVRWRGDGVVETFELGGHPKAKRCHAWSYEQNGETQYVTVLELPPVDSAESDVKVAIAAKAKA